MAVLTWMVIEIVIRPAAIKECSRPRERATSSHQVRYRVSTGKRQHLLIFILKNDV
jgi:hypothetical protein